MKRFSITLSDKEDEQLEEMRRWFVNKQGLSLSKCAIMKHLSYVVFNVICDNPPIGEFLGDKSLPKEGNF